MPNRTRLEERTGYNFYSVHTWLARWNQVVSVSLYWNEKNNMSTLIEVFKVFLMYFKPKNLRIKWSMRIKATVSGFSKSTKKNQEFMVS